MVGKLWPVEIVDFARISGGNVASFGVGDAGGRVVLFAQGKG